MSAQITCRNAHSNFIIPLNTNAHYRFLITYSIMILSKEWGREHQHTCKQLELLLSVSQQRTSLSPFIYNSNNPSKSIVRQPLASGGRKAKGTQRDRRAFLRITGSTSTAAGALHVRAQTKQTLNTGNLCQIKI